MTAIGVMMAVLVAASAGGVYAASLDTGTTNSQSVSDLQQGTQIVVNQTSSTVHQPQGQSMDADGAFKFKNDAGTVVHIEDQLTAVNASAGEYRANLTDEEIRQNFEFADDQNTTYTLVVVNNTTVDNPATHSITFNITGENMSNRVITSAEAENGSNVELEDNRKTVLGYTIKGEKSAVVEEQNIAVDNGTEIVTVRYADSNVSERLGVDTTDTVPVFEESVYLNGDISKTFGASPSDVTSTYAVSHEDHVAVYPGDDYSQSSIDVKVDTEGLGLFNADDVWDLYGSSGLDDWAKTNAGL